MTIKELKNTAEYKSGMFKIIKCPCCGDYTLDNNWICDCGWEYDGIENPDEYSQVNQCSITEYKKI